MKKITITITIILLALAAVFLLKPNKEVPIHLRVSSFDKLPGWKQADAKRSLVTFQQSCKTMLRQNPQQSAGSQQITMQIGEWYPACRAALQLKSINDKKARSFFQKWFTPVEFYDKKPVTGLFTGYYMPLLHGSLTKTDEFNVPLYGLPEDLVSVDLSHFTKGVITKHTFGRVEKGALKPYYTRKDINKGAIEKKAPVIVWVNSQIDRLYLEIQGSGIVKLPNGDKIYVGYAGENGAPYTAIGKVLIDRGIMTKDNASMQRIRAYLDQNPKKMMSIINKNASFVFFKVLNQKVALGAQGIGLTAGYSLAVDRQWIPLGTPLWLSTTRPDAKSGSPLNFQRLMVAQDTGGAIRGAVRGDVFWGSGKDATNIAGLMKNPGHYWLLLPKETVKQAVPSSEKIS